MAKKKATRKKAAAKKKTPLVPAVKGSSTPGVRSRVGRPEVANPANPNTQVKVWEAYAELRSVNLVAEKLKIPSWVVRAVVAQDQPKVRQLIEHHIEQHVAKLEVTGMRAQKVMDDCLALAQALVDETNAAAREGRLTRIIGTDGCAMPVMAATEFLIMTRLMDQVRAIVQMSLQASAAFRRGETLPSSPDDEGPGAYDFEKMTDQQLARLLTEGGVDLPPILAAKVKRISSTTAKKSPAGTTLKGEPAGTPEEDG